MALKNGNYAAFVYLLASFVCLATGLVADMLWPFVFSGLFLALTFVFWRLPKPIWVVSE